MTEDEKMLIKIELYKAYNKLPKHCKDSTKFVIAVQQGLECAQRKLEENKKKQKGMIFCEK